MSNSDTIKVLFVSSANKSKNKEVVPFIRAQGASLKALGIEVSYFPIHGRGVKGYLRQVPKLKQWLEDNPVDIIHAHYTLSGWVAVLAQPKVPVVLSLMGTDAYGLYVGKNKVTLGSRYLTGLTLLIQPFVDAIISKSPNIDKFVYRKGIANIIPNGVRLEQFKIYADGCREELGLQPDKKYVLFLGSKSNKRKNFRLVEEAVNRLDSDEVELLTPYPVSHDLVVKYLNSVDVLAMSSFMEGSPNVVKEAMACNCPVIVTDVGDAAWVVNDTPGCFVSSFDPADYARNLERAIEFSEKEGRTEGRERIKSLGLEASAVANRLASLYRDLAEPVPDKHEVAL